MALTPEVMAEALALRPIVLIGDVWGWKESFLKHLMYVSAFEEFSARCIYIHRSWFPGSADSDLKAFVMSEIEAQLLKRYAVKRVRGLLCKGRLPWRVGTIQEGDIWELDQLRPTRIQQETSGVLEVKIRNKPEHLRHSVQHIVAGRNQQ